MQSPADYLWLCLAASAAGAINALAGGGTLLTFPTLVSVLVKSRPVGSLAIAEVLANGTSTVALVPASLGSSWGFRRETYELRRLLMWLLPPSPADSYRGLGASVTAGSAVVMFKPDATEQDIRRALTRSGARLIGGPTVTGAYVLGLPAGRQHAALTELRTQSAVVLAESLDAGSQP